jgi:hypothetical protein
LKPKLLLPKKLDVLGIDISEHLLDLVMGHHPLFCVEVVEASLLVGGGHGLVVDGYDAVLDCRGPLGLEVNVVVEEREQRFIEFGAFIKHVEGFEPNFLSILWFLFREDRHNRLQY